MEVGGETPPLFTKSCEQIAGERHNLFTSYSNRQSMPAALSPGCYFRDVRSFAGRFPSSILGRPDFLRLAR